MDRFQRDAMTHYVSRYIGGLIGVVGLTVLCVALAGCAGVQVRTFNDGVGATHSGIIVAAETIEAVCRATEIGGPCDPDSPITTTQKDRAKQALTDALDTLDLALSLYAQGDEGGAQARLAQAQALLKIAEEIARERN